MNDMKFRRVTASKPKRAVGSQTRQAPARLRTRTSQPVKPQPKKWPKIVLGILTLVIILVLLNLPYFWKNAKFLVSKPAPILNQATDTPKLNNKIEPNTLIIDSLGLKLPVVYESQKDEDVFQKDLQNGVVHYPDTAKPGEYGNVYIFGHSSDYLWSRGNYKTAFALLPKIQKGATIVISDDRGNAYNYKVTDTAVISPKDLSVLDQHQYQKRLLTLQTSYPIGTALKRFVVKAEIEEPKTDQVIPQVGT